MKGSQEQVAQVEELLILDDHERQLVEEKGTTVHYSRGHIIFSANEIADRVYYIQNGYVKIYQINDDGREVTVGSIRNPGEMMALAETLYHSKRTFFAGAITDVDLVVLTKNQFIDLLNTEPRLAVKVAKLLGARMRAAESLVYELVCWQAPGRLALLLLRISERCGIDTDEGTRIKLRLTHSDIASMIGVTRQTVTSLLNTFRDEHSIDVRGREIIIKDPKKLASWVV